MVPISNNSQDAVPVTILTGFLGAGKTTLLNRILSGDHGLRVAVLVNDFGAINIDADLIVGVEDNVMSLANGCVCCTIRDDLVETVMETINRPEAPEYILLEASGVADPGSISMTFMDSGLRDRIRLDSVTCVVDAEQIFAHQEYPQLTMLKLRQIGFADMVIVNKVDLAGSETVRRVRAWIDEHFNRVRVVEANHCDVPLEILLSVGRFDPSQLDFDAQAIARQGPQSGDPDRAHEHHQHDHSQSFSTWCYESQRPMSLKALQTMVKRELPGAIYRCKGVIHVAEAPDRRAILQVVGRRADVTLLDPWNGRKPMTRIVAIGASGDLDPRELRSKFDRCLSSPPAVGSAVLP